MNDKNGEAKEYVLKHAKEKDVKFIRLWFTDVLGALKSVSITVEELEHALEYGMGFDGSSIEGFARIDESDMVAMPDPTSFRILPWRPTKNAVARMFCDILTPAGKPFEGDPRYVLRRNLENTKRLGYTYYVGTEMEYFYFQNSSGTKQLDIGGYFDQTPLDMASDLRRDTVLTLEEMGIPVYSSHHEVAGSQHEIDLRYTDALNMADGVMTFKVVAKEIASKYGVYASFMPKPIGTENGSGMHINVSLYKGSQNLFFDSHDKIRLSKTARYFLGGVLNRAAEMTSITNQWINSYKRLVPGFEAPVYISWASKNRSDLIRVPEYRPGRHDSTRFEYRAPDPACNPYLAFSVLLAAGLEGIEKKIEPPEPIAQNVFGMSAAERQERGIKMLPKDMYEAISLTEKSPLVKKALGEHVFNSFIQNKKIEWENYRSQVTDYEINRYLPIL
ncbi:MAG: glutamine synthetase [Dehalococcoidia bacterium]|nr:glutamine synthetase [Dehalococcoidia bacterium]